MVRPIMTLPSLRASRLLLIPCLVLSGAAGCSHKRSVMRPVYGNPVRAAAPGCTTPGCSTGGTVIAAPPVDGEPFASPSESTTAIPATPPAASDYDTVVPARISPPVPSDAGDREPGLNLRYSDPKPPASSSIDDGPMPELTRPNASRATPRRTTTRSGNRLSPVSLREAVRPYVDSPDDLFQPPKADRPWRYVVLHHSAGASGGYARIDREHRKTLGWNGCGYHFVIGNGTDTPDGQIEVAERWVEQKNGVHCRDGKNPDVNEYGIGVCLVGNFDQSPPTPKQLAAARSLVAYLEARYQIPADHIDTHSDLATGPTACPGKFFPSVASL